MKTLLYMLPILMLAACGRKAEDTQYLVPQGLEGRINIFFDIKQGDACLYESGERVLQVAPGKCCLTQCKPNYGVFKEEFFIVDVEGRKTPLTKNDSLHVYTIGTGSISHEGHEIHFYSFIICPPHRYAHWLKEDLSTACLLPE